VSALTKIVTAVAVLAVCGRPAESGAKRADRKEPRIFLPREPNLLLDSETNLRNQSHEIVRKKSILTIRFH
jgi:hypothetical protein